MQSGTFSGFAGLHLAPQLLHDLHRCLPSASVPGQHDRPVCILTDIHCHAFTTQPHVLLCGMVSAQLQEEQLLHGCYSRAAQSSPNLLRNLQDAVGGAGYSGGRGRATVHAHRIGRGPERAAHGGPARLWGRQRLLLQKH